MIKTKKELIKFIKEEIYKATGVKVNVEYAGVHKTGNSQEYFSFEIDCPTISDQLENNTISFIMKYAKKDYFKEGFVLDEDDIKERLEDVIEEIKNRLEEEE